MPTPANMNEGGATVPKYFLSDEHNADADKYPPFMGKSLCLRDGDAQPWFIARFENCDPEHIADVMEALNTHAANKTSLLALREEVGRLREALERIESMAPDPSACNEMALIVGVMAMRDEARAALKETRG